MAASSTAVGAQHIVVGTAGHIDHGKSTLVHALTGIDPDRLKEEKERGITIELGFASRRSDETTVAFVDVPGHERFVKTMLAGIGGIDCVMLIVAADESVMPQTREHFDICRLLQVRRGIVVLTKADLVDAETLELVRLEVRELVQGSFLEDAPVVRRVGTQRRRPRCPAQYAGRDCGASVVAPQRRGGTAADRSRLLDAGFWHGRDRDAGDRASARGRRARAGAG